ncbi:MAG: hypothetical protein HC927_04070 [Deltaproteobacteria bacterium]|nr:hypothetical protein [Deltaproteobacteria bacterium]
MVQASAALWREPAASLYPRPVHRRLWITSSIALALACNSPSEGDDEVGDTSETDESASESSESASTSSDTSSDEGTIPEDAAWVEVELGAAVNEVDERYLSYALDTDKVVYQQFDFERPRLLALTAELSPALLRIGGTRADQVYYDMSDTPLAEAPSGYERVMDRATWDAACDFAEALGVEMLFTINAGPGPRDDQGQWIDAQARELIEYTIARDCPVTVWEFGNEIGAFGLEHNYPLDGEQYAADFAVFAALVDEIDPDARTAGPASMYWPLEGEIFVPIIEPLLAMQGELVDIATWHYYPQQSSSCPVATRGVDKPLFPLGWLDTIETWAAEVEGYRATHAPNAEVWLGETGHAQCGGEPGISNTFASNFWWLDQLGRMALRDQPLAIRQALSGGAYNLIEDSMLEPAPDYYASVLWKRHMGPEVLAVQLQNAPEGLLAYAHCDVASDGAVVVLVINYDASASVPVAFLDGTLEFEAGITDVAQPIVLVALEAALEEHVEDGALVALPQGAQARRSRSRRGRGNGRR